MLISANLHLDVAKLRIGRIVSGDGPLACRLPGNAVSRRVWLQHVHRRTCSGRLAGRVSTLRFRLEIKCDPFACCGSLARA